MKNKNLVAIISVFMSKVVGQGLNYLTNILLARALMPETFGLWVTLLSIMTLAAQFSDMGLNTGYVTLASKRSKGSIEKNILNRYTLFLKLSIAALIIIVSLFFSGHIAELVFNNKDHTYFIVLAFILSIGLSLFGYSNSFLQIYDKLKLFSILDFSNNVIKFVLCFILIQAGNFQLDWYLIIYAIIPFVLFFFIFFKMIYTELSVKTEDLLLHRKELLGSMFTFTKWSLIASLSVIILTRTDIFLIQYFHSSYEVGLFASANQLAMIFPVISASISTVLLPKVAQLQRKHDFKNYYKKVLMFIPVLLIMLLIIMFCSELLVDIVLGNDYASIVPAFRILIATYIISVFINPLSLILYSLRKEKMFTLLNLSQLLINVVLNLLLIPKYGIIGASVTSLCVYLFAAVFIILLTKKYINELAQ
ncbi:oligosaccharide flippase family protein [Paenibacillus sp. NPDC057967]|uniref:oligosaccharide flippase family protein n=1 Tax=Paenibacillus sp. NPDC057967 TaxID=3346293 RepID=UPI0036DF1B94